MSKYRWKENIVLLGDASSDTTKSINPLTFTGAPCQQAQTNNKQHYLFSDFSATQINFIH